MCVNNASFHCSIRQTYVEAYSLARMYRTLPPLHRQSVLIRLGRVDHRAGRSVHEDARAPERASTSVALTCHAPSHPLFREMTVVVPCATGRAIEEPIFTPSSRLSLSSNMFRTPNHLPPHLRPINTRIQLLIHQPTNHHIIPSHQIQPMRLLRRRLIIILGPDYALEGVFEHEIGDLVAGDEGAG